MKKLLLLLGLFCGIFSYAQTVPTLGVGLEALTLNKGSYDIEVLTKIILEKQKELKNEALKRFMFKMFPETNFTTRFYVQNCLNILLNEKNPQVIEKEILELTTNYTIALGVTKALVELNDNVFSLEEKELANFIYPKSNVRIINESYDKQIQNLKNQELFKSTIKALNKEISDIEVNLKQAIEEKNYDKSKKLNKDYNNKKNELSKIKLKANYLDTPGLSDDSLVDGAKFPFGLKVDLVSLSLSENELIRKKGFFKNKIDFREEINFESFKLNLKKIALITTKIENLLNPYIENYEIIDAFLKNSNLENSTKNISEELSKVYLNQLTLNNEFIETLDSYLKQGINSKNLVSSLTEAINLKNTLTIKSNVYDLKNINKTELKKLKETGYGNLKFDEAIIQITAANNFINTLIDKYNEILVLGNELKIKRIEGFSKIDIKIKDPEYYITNIDQKGNSTASLQKDAQKKDALKQEINRLTDYKTILSQNQNDDTATNLVKIDADIEVKNNEITAINNKYKIEKIDEITNVLKSLDDKQNLFDLDLEAKIKEAKELITGSSVFFNEFLNKLINDINVLEENLKLTQLASEDKNKIVAVYSDLFEKLNHLKDNNNINLEDVNFLEKDILKRVYETKLIDVTNENKKYNDLINQIKFLSPLLKIKIITDKKLNFKYSKNFISLFEFIGNLNKLDKAKTYTSIIDLLRENSEVIIADLPEGKFKEGYKIFVNGMKKYTLINTNSDVKKEYVEIDIVSFLNDLQQYYNRNNPSKFSLYLSVGLNQNLFINDFSFPNSEEKINSIGFASEKIGVKLKLLDFKKYSGYENVIKSDVYLNKRSPFINEWYVVWYGSGLLYSLANTSTNQNFDFAHLGFGTGIRFYNSLDLNVTLGLPFVKNENFGNNGFIGLGLDIPLGEYLEGLGNK